MSCKKGGTYELLFKYIHKSCLLKYSSGYFILYTVCDNLFLID